LIEKPKKVLSQRKKSIKEKINSKGDDKR